MIRPKQNLIESMSSPLFLYTTNSGAVTWDFSSSLLNFTAATSTNSGTMASDMIQQVTTASSSLSTSTFNSTLGNFTETVSSPLLNETVAKAFPSAAVSTSTSFLPPIGISTLLFIISGFFNFSLLWSLLLYPISVFGWKLYLIDDERHLQILKQKFVRAATITNNNEAFGWIFGQWYIGYIYQTGDRFNKSQSCYLLATKDMMNQVTQPVFTPCVGRKEVFITLHDRCGSYDFIYYTERKLNVTDFVARDAQQKAISHIEDYYKAHKFATVLLSGPPNAGKSVIALLLAKQLSGSLVYEFNPTEPGNNFNNLYNKANPTMSCPLIVTFEEVDIMVDALHHGKVQRHDSKPITIYNKATWNTFMDNIDHRFYPYVVFLFTTNRSFQWFNELDASYMRQGRVNVKLLLTEATCENMSPSIQNNTNAATTIISNDANTNIINTTIINATVDNTNNDATNTSTNTTDTNNTSSSTTSTMTTSTNSISTSNNSETETADPPATANDNTISSVSRIIPTIDPNNLITIAQ